jgi:arylsulfatase B
VTDLWNTVPGGPPGGSGAVGINNSYACSQTNQASGCVWEDDILAQRMLSVIGAHNATQPLFLFWALHSVHEPYEVPSADLARFASVDVQVRQYYDAMVFHADAVIGNVTGALKAAGLWESTLLVVTSDNGGPVAKAPAPVGLINTEGGNNWPLRGGKIGNLEGGVRVNAFVAGGFVPAALRGTVNGGWIHMADW